jgi:ATP-dependent helicase HrpB
MDSKVSAATRIEVVTEGIFTRMLVAEPELQGIAAVLFDEIHERSLESDLALALTLEAREALCPDLRLLLMSATLDGAAYDAIVPGLVRLESQGRMFPVELRHIGRNPAMRIEDAMAAAVRSALSSEPGSVLAFLPGAAEIERTAERLSDRLPDDVDLYRLYGARDSADQRTAIRPPPQGRRKVVLATSIAETSITIDGVRIVIDSGLSRRPRLDRAVGMTRLVTERASQAAITQRAGRAGRTAPGVAIRLWEAGETAGRLRFDPPEILESDLTGLCLETARWGVPDPRALNWLDPPPGAAVADARSRLLALGALDDDGRPTPHGNAIAALPLPPALGHMLVAAAGLGLAGLAARLAVLLGERGLGGNSRDLDERLRQWSRDRSPRAETARRLADRWARSVGGGTTEPAPDAIGQLLALAYPDRVARRRGPAGAPWLMANGRAVTPMDGEPLASAPWIIVADAAGSAAGARLLSGGAIEAASVEQLFDDRIESRAIFAFDPISGGVTAEAQRRLGAIILGRSPAERPDPAQLRNALLEGVRQHGIALLPWGDASAALRARIAFARQHGMDALPDVSDAGLTASLGDWLAPLLAGKRKLGDLTDAVLCEALANTIDWVVRRELDSFAPTQFTTPAGSHHSIDYAAEAGPTVAMRVQTLFGLGTHPTVAGGRVPLTLALTSPAGRPIQVTTDLPRFWTGSWAEVRRELRGRYPKHPWPEDPAAAVPTLRAKRPGQQE